MSGRQKILVFDSGLGGLTVYRAIRALRSDADYLYLGDDALFPYGALAPDVLIARVDQVIAEAMADFAADCIVIACNTASTLVLPSLRARYSIPIVGTVPAIKPAAAATRSGLISVLATPGTVSRDYTQDLIRDFAAEVAVTLVGSKALAGLAERALRGEGLDRGAIAAEIAPCFVERDGHRTDVIVLACTHYPLLLDTLRDLAPWPVEWIDPAPAIARRVVQVLGEAGMGGQGCFSFRLTSGANIPLEVSLIARGAELGLLPGDLKSLLSRFPLGDLCEVLHFREVGGQAHCFDLIHALSEHLKQVPASTVVPVLARVAQLPDIPEGQDAEIFWALVNRLQQETSRTIHDEMTGWTFSEIPSLRMAGILVLGQYGWPARQQDDGRWPYADATLLHIDRLLLDPDEGVAEAALTAAGHQRAGDISLIARWAGHPSAEMRWKAAVALLQRDEKPARTLLIGLSNDPETRVRDWATFGLGSQSEVDAADIRDALAARLADTDDETRGEALLGLARRGDPRAKIAILRELQAENTGILVFEAIVEMPHPEFLPYLHAASGMEISDCCLRKGVIAAIAACEKLDPLRQD